MIAPAVRVLVVDDEPALRHTVSCILAEEGYEVATACDGEEALASAAELSPTIILCDLRMPRLGGLELLERYRATGGRGLVIAMTAYGDIETAVGAMQRGAYDYIAKPFHAEEIVLVVRKAVERERLLARVQALESELGAREAEGRIVGASRVLRGAIAVARKVAPYPSTVLITGESGTGKELFARLVHDESPRADRPFVAVNCGAIPESLLESELFGHVRGAFTGAVADRAGLFADAEGGTLFLDEIGELPLPLQVKLLRALQEGEVRAVGGSESRKVDVRVIAATNRDLAEEVGERRFREDLFYRINVVSIHLPPLRDRLEDVAPLARHFVARYAARLGMRDASIGAPALAALARYPWPGNVRELENAIERALVLAGGAAIALEHLPDVVRGVPSTNGPPRSTGDADLSVKRRVRELERGLIAAALARTDGNRTQAARLLELSHRALLYKIREYGLDA
ncbi:MAG TPA: sigma-54 dependent transcriptional regulator [Gemmatimonadaceae bacterium]|nr:sigma-54 dependent transcriptional regulator [Gemmatimonadaceae bacterium]